MVYQNVKNMEPIEDDFPKNLLFLADKNCAEFVSYTRKIDVLKTVQIAVLSKYCQTLFSQSSRMGSSSYLKIHKRNRFFCLAGS